MTSYFAEFQKFSFLASLLFFSFFASAEVTITTSGGVALGSYKAGYHYYLTNALKKNKIPVISVAGASAGGITSYLTFDNLCRENNETPEDSLYWKMWVNTGLDEIYNKSKVTKISLFHRDGMKLHLDELQKRFINGYPKTCKMVLILPVTNLDIYNQFRDKRVSSPSIKNYFVIELQGHGIGTSVKNIILDGKTNTQRLLPFGKQPEDNFELIKKVLYATSAFPVAFEPVPIPNCTTEVKKCSFQTAKVDYFLDGGILDNAPLDLSDAFLKLMTPKTYRKNIQHIYINTSNVAFVPLIANVPIEEKTANLTSLLSSQISNVVEIARNQEETHLVQSDSSILDRSLVGSTILPPMSSPLFAFFGFFDKSFREYDFYLGMHDARTLLKEKLAASAKDLPPLPDSQLNRCFDLFRREVWSETEVKACQLPSKATHPNMKKALQVSILRAWNFCQSDISKKEQRFDKVCRFHRSMDVPLNVTEIEEFKGKPSTSVDDISYIISALDHYEFDFGDLDKNYGYLNSSSTKIHQVLRRILDELEKKQPLEDRAIISILDSRILTPIDEVAPEFTTFTNIGTAFEVGASKAFLGFSKDIHFTSSLLFQGLETFLSKEKDRFGVIPTIGLEIDPDFFHLTSLNFRFGIQYGYQFLSNTNSESPDCSSVHKDYSGKDCKGEVAILNTSILFLERLNLKISLGYYNKSEDAFPPNFAHLMIGYHFF